MLRSDDARVRRSAGALVVALLALLLAGCSSGSPAQIPAGQSSDSGSTQGPDIEARSPDSARSKLRLALADPCYTSRDPRAVWPRCGRWVEETASIARTAASALPNDAAVTGAVPAVAATHDAFVARGCPSSGPAVPLDANACVGALTSVRAAVTQLSAALGTPS